MTGKITSPDGKAWTLPQLLSYRVEWSDGRACDAIELEFPAAAGDAAALEAVTRVWAYEAERTVFCGVVDEVTVTLDGRGRTAVLTGRGLGARLRDNQVRANTYQRATIRDILALYATPYGIFRTDGTIKNAVSSFAVDSGDTAWQALAGFCRHAAGRTPYFSPDGTLMLGPPETRPSLRLTDEGAISAEARTCWYGVISEQVSVDRSSGRQTAEQNAEFLKAGGFARRVTARGGESVHASEKTAAQRVAEAAEGWKTLTVTLPGSFLAEVGQLADVALQNLGVSGQFRVTDVTSRLDSGGARCTIGLRKENA